jgi:hypothetical protein
VSADGTLTYTPAPDAFGSSQFRVRVQDTGGDANGGSDYSEAQWFTITVNPVNDPPVVGSVAAASQTVQYSDGIAPIVVTASDPDSPSLSLATNGLPAGLTLGAAACTPSGNGSECRWTLSGSVGVAAGVYEPWFTITDDGGLTVNASASIQVETENAESALLSGNPFSVPVAQAGGDSQPFALQVAVRESYDAAAATEPQGTLPAPGDITRASVELELVPLGPGNVVRPSGACQPTSNGLAGYAQVLTVSCPFDGVPVNAYVARTRVVGDSYHGAGTTEDMVFVHDPSRGFTTGGGWIHWPGTLDETSFGFNAKYGPHGDAKGSLELVREMADGSGRYELQSDSVVALALGTRDDGAGNFWAIFTGSASLLAPGMLEAESGYEFTVYVEQTGAGVDRLWIELRDPNGNPVEALSLPARAGAGAVTLSGGNLTMHDPQGQDPAKKDGSGKSSDRKKAPEDRSQGGKGKSKP